MSVKINPAKEFLKCKLNPLYFIYTYCKVPVVGGYVKISFDNTLSKHRAIIKSIYRFHNVVILGSRRAFKTTFALLYGLWGSLFYPNYKVVIVNYKKDTAKDNLNFIKAVYKELPDFLKVPLKWKGEKLEYIEFVNGSKISIMVPASNVDPNTIGRGLNIPLLIWDETAFVKGAEEIWAAAQPALRSAREQAIKHNYPYGIFLISTPNGKEGKGKFFYEQYSYATPIEELYDLEEEKWLSDNPDELYQQILEQNPYRNTFIRIRIHWSEFPQYDDEWYEEQKRELGYYVSAKGRRRVNQELDLMFLGSEESLFPDEVLSELKPKKSVETISLSYGAHLKIFEELNPDKFYIFGIDTAKTISGDYSAIEVFDESFNQIAELKYKFGMVERFADVIKQIIQIFIKEYKIPYNKIKLFIENNSFGNQVVESLINDTEFNYEQLIYYQIKKNGVIDYGITTTGKNKEVIVDCLYEAILENPERIKSQDLISELHVIERKGQKIQAAKGYHDDLFMAASFAAYGRKELIKSGEIIVNEEEIEKTRKLYHSLFSNIHLVTPKDIENREKVIFEDYILEKSPNITDNVDDLTKTINEVPFIL